MESERKFVVARLRREGNGERLLSGYKVFFWDDENILELDIGRSYTTL